MWPIASEQMIGGAAHELGGEIEHGEHGARAAGVALVVELQLAGESVLSDELPDEEAQKRDQQQRGQAVAGA